MIAMIAEMTIMEGKKKKKERKGHYREPPNWVPALKDLMLMRPCNLYAFLLLHFISLTPLFFFFFQKKRRKKSKRKVKKKMKNKKKKVR